MVLAHAFHDHQIALNGSWPNIQGSRPDTLDYDSNKWCHAAMTFHHTTREQTEALWALDRASVGVKVRSFILRVVVAGEIYTFKAKGLIWRAEHDRLRHLLHPRLPAPRLPKRRLRQRRRFHALPAQPLPRTLGNALSAWETCGHTVSLSMGS